MSPHCYAAWATSVFIGMLRFFYTTVDVGSAVPRRILIWNGDITFVCVILESVQILSPIQVFRFAHHCILSTVPRRGRNDAVRESRIDFIRVIGIVIAKAICEFLWLLVTSAEVFVIDRGCQDR